MKTAELQLQTLGYAQVKTYLFATLFIVGNIVLPQIVHFVPHGGFIFLPIYFFTLIGAYKYGWKVGLLIAVFSPLINNFLFEMPSHGMLPAILIKSILLAIMAGCASLYFKRISLPILVLIVIGYQAIGTLAEWAIGGSFFYAIQDFRIGFLGMALQIFGGYFLIKGWTNNKGIY